MSADLAANGAFVTAADLAAYDVRDDAPVTGTYRGLTLATSPAAARRPDARRDPQHPGGLRPGCDGHNSPEYIYRVAMAMKAAFADRNPHLGDPAFVDVPLAWMTSKERAAYWRAQIDAGRRSWSATRRSTAPDTTHVSRGRRARHLRGPDPLAGMARRA